MPPQMKLATMHRPLKPIYDRLYVSRKRGRGFASTDDLHIFMGLKNIQKKGKESLFTVDSNININKLEPN